MNLKKEDLLQNAKSHCFFIGVNDSGAELSKANSPYGLAGIHYLQKHLNMPADATFISTPDLTISRNKERWRSGFGYGGKISWGDGTREMIVLNVKPNACGMLVGGIDELPDSKLLIRKLHAMEKDKVKIDGTEVEWDFFKSNHFIDLFVTKQIAKTDFEIKEFAFIIHGASCEFREDSDSGFGLYFDKSKELLNMADHVETPFQTLHVLHGKKAGQFYERYRYIDEFSKRKRKLAAEMLFGDFQEISNVNHQGMINMNEVVLGCHFAENGEKTLYPLVLRGDLPSYLVRAVPNLSAETIELLGFERRARELGVYEKLMSANVIPHGGGYILPDVLTVNTVIEIDRERYFEVEMQNDRGKKIISEVGELPFEYRGRKVVLRAMELNLLETVVKLIPKYVLKI